MRRLLRAPEAHVATFSFLLNYPWEMLQAPLFQRVGSGDHWQQVKVCTAAAVADALISLLSYGAASLVSRGRHWLLRPPAPTWLAYMVAGLVITVGAEVLATGPLGLWEYAADMPLIPIVNVGITPMLQWLILPPLILWFARNQMIGLSADR